MQVPLFFLPVEWTGLFCDGPFLLFPSNEHFGADRRNCHGKVHGREDHAETRANDEILRF